MRYYLSKKFKRNLDKLSGSVKRQFVERRKLFESEPYHYLLNNHALTGQYSDCRSLNINGDVRIIFYYIDDNTVHLVDIGTHSQLYK